MQILRTALSEAALLTGAIRVEVKRAHKTMCVNLLIGLSLKIKILRIDACANGGGKGGWLLVI